MAPATVVRGGAALAGRELPSLAQAAFGRINSVREAGRDMAIGASAGAAGRTARELAPEAWKPAAEIAGGLLGGVAAAGATAPGAVARTVARPPAGVQSAHGYGRGNGATIARPEPHLRAFDANNPVGTAAMEAGRGFRTPNYDGAALSQVDWDLPRFVFRGESRPEGRIFQTGFIPRGDSTDLLAHALDNQHAPSAFVPASLSFEEAKGFGRNVYVIRSTNGINVNRALGPQSPYPHEQEIAIFGGVSPPNIRAVTKLSKGISILNPDYKP